MRVSGLRFQVSGSRFKVQDNSGIAHVLESGFTGLTDLQDCESVKYSAKSAICVQIREISENQT